jgi:hypothetical protein
MYITEVMDYVSLFICIEKEVKFLATSYLASVHSRTAVNRPISLVLLMAYRMYSGWLFVNNVVTARI